MDYWANSLMSWSVDISDQLTEYFRFKKHENKEIMETIRQRLKNIDETNKRVD